MRNLFLAILSIWLLAEPMSVEAKEPSIRMIGRKTGIVNTPQFAVTDIAKIYSESIHDDDAIITLKQIALGTSPKPGESITITASQILERLREEGITVSEIGYALPRVITVTRAARAITEHEVKVAIHNAIKQLDGLSLELRGLVYRKPIQVAPGKLALSAQLAPGRGPGQYQAQLLAEVADADPVRFSVPVKVSEWIQVPVARRALPPGSIVSEYDLSMARADLSELPVDVARDKEQILGFETKRSVSHGEAFRKRKLVMPAVIENGDRVTLQYKTKLLEATASGVALENGVVGQQIRVRNENSKRLISGTVVESGLVKVMP